MLLSEGGHPRRCARGGVYSLWLIELVVIIIASYAMDTARFPAGVLLRSALALRPHFARMTGNGGSRSRPYHRAMGEAVGAMLLPELSLFPCSVVFTELVTARRCAARLSGGLLRLRMAPSPRHSAARVRRFSSTLLAPECVLPHINRLAFPGGLPVWPLFRLPSWREEKATRRIWSYTAAAAHLCAGLNGREDDGGVDDGRGCRRRREPLKFGVHRH